MNIYSTSFSSEDIAFAREYNLGIEIAQYTDPVFMDGFEDNHPQVTQILQGIQGVAMHGAYLDTFYTSKDPLIADVSRLRFGQSIKVADFHGIPQVVFHSGYRQFFDGYSAGTREAFLKKAIAFWGDFVESVPDGITVYLENVEDDSPDILASIIQGIDSPKIRCCLDVGHAHCNAATPLATWVDALGDYIGHVHLSDNDGTMDQHLPLGAGTGPLLPTIQQLLDRVGKDISFVLECSIPQSFEWLKQSGLVS